MKRTGIIIAAALGVGAIAVGVAAAKSGWRGHHGGGAHMDRAFGLIDTDGDGAVSRAEADAAGAALFARADGDGDGALTADELTAAALEHMRLMAERRAAHAIGRLDSDGDGALSLAEVEARLGDRPGRMFDRLDANGDDMVTREEAMRMARRHGHGHHHGGGHGADAE